MRADAVRTGIRGARIAVVAGRPVVTGVIVLVRGRAGIQRARVRIVAVVRSADTSSGNGARVDRAAGPIEANVIDRVVKASSAGIAVVNRAFEIIAAIEVEAPRAAGAQA